MAISLVTHRKGSKRSEFLEAAERLKSFVTKHGAKDFQLFSQVAGPDAGQWVLVIRFSDWEPYGRTMAAVAADPELANTIGGREAIGEMTSRRLIAEQDM